MTGIKEKSTLVQLKLEALIAKGKRKETYQAGRYREVVEARAEKAEPLGGSRRYVGLGFSFQTNQ